MNKLIILNLTMTFQATSEMIHPVVLCDESSRVLIDCGFAGALPQIEEELERNKIQPQDISHIMLTHQDHDHIGAAAEFQRKYPNVIIMASEKEAPYITGSRKSLRLEQAEELQKVLPPQMQEFGTLFCNHLRSIEPVPINQLLQDGDQLPFGGGCEVITTPGHTPGHISFYLSEFDTLIAGDAIALENGIPVIANPQFTLDMELAQTSMQKLLDHPAHKMICYHGGVFQKDETK
jgi:glyoxylase-like metal-dependent hydrolase (beta-lactamase superfamily II)